MPNDVRSSRNLVRTLAMVCIVAAGIVSIVGSGGGSVDGCIFAPCPGDFPPEPATPTIEPESSVVQVGGTTTFSARAPGIANAVYEWSRSQQGGPFVVIAGATGQTFTVAGAQLPDDGARFSVRVFGEFGGHQVTVAGTTALLAVSSMPGTVFKDSEFAAADWVDAAIAEPAVNGPTHSAEQAASGGNPGAYRKLTLGLTAGPSSLFVFEIFEPAAYDPASQGPVYLVGFAQDCVALPGTLGVGPTLTIEQDGRRYIAGAPSPCGTSTWNASVFPVNFSAANFLLVDGPACVAGASCPDFTAAGRPIRFGFANSNQALAGIPALAGGFGIDNWQVTVWRK